MCVCVCLISRCQLSLEFVFVVFFLDFSNIFLVSLSTLLSLTLLIYAWDGFSKLHLEWHKVTTARHLYTTLVMICDNSLLTHTPWWQILFTFLYTRMKVTIKKEKKAWKVIYIWLASRKWFFFKYIYALKIFYHTYLSEIHCLQEYFSKLLISFVLKLCCLCPETIVTFA